MVPSDTSDAVAAKEEFRDGIVDELSSAGSAGWNVARDLWGVRMLNWLGRPDAWYFRDVDPEIGTE
jgi:hypothetical protein